MRRVIEPLLSGGEEREFSNRDIEYARDLGIVARDTPFAHRQSRLRGGRAARADQRGAGRIGSGDCLVRRCRRRLGCRQIARCLSGVLPGALRALGRPFRLPGGPGRNCCCRPSCNGWRTGEGASSAEYGLGRGRTDLLIVWPQAGRNHKFVVECKVVHKGLKTTIHEGLRQTRGYMDRLCRRLGAPRRLRPQGRPALGGQDLLSRRVRGRDGDNSVGHVRRRGGGYRGAPFPAPKSVAARPPSSPLPCAPRLFRFDEHGARRRAAARIARRAPSRGGSCQTMPFLSSSSPRQKAFRGSREECR